MAEGRAAYSATIGSALALAVAAAGCARGVARDPTLESLSTDRAEVTTPTAVEVVSVEPVVWRTSALGCPQPDSFYLQVLTPGFRLTVSAGDRSATYHTDRSVPPTIVRCDGATAEEGLPDS